MIEQIEAALNEPFIVDLYQETTPKQGNNGEYSGFCPFHEDKHRSFSFNVFSNGLYYCHGCGEKGNIYDYLKKVKKVSKPFLFLCDQFDLESIGDKSYNQTVKPSTVKKTLQSAIREQIEEPLYVEPELIRKAKENLFVNHPEKLQQLQDWGIKLDVIKNYNLGYQTDHYGPRIWIPIKDGFGKFVNIRKYDPTKKIKMLPHNIGYGKNRLWPIDNLNSDVVYIMEGERDTLLAISNNLNAITNTGGANAWDEAWNIKFKNKNVIICMDIDNPGKKASDKRAKGILPFAKQVKIVTLPLSKTKYPKGDFSDYIIKENKTVDDFLAEVEKSPPLSHTDEIHVILAEASKHHLINKKCLIKNVLCSGKDTNPFAVPKTVTAKCSGPRDERKCRDCSLNKEDFTRTFQKDDDFLLSLIKVTDTIVNSKLKTKLGIFNRCFENKIEMKEFYNVENIRLMPEISYNIEEKYEHVYRNGYYILDEGKFIQTNKSYTVKAKTVLEKNTQYVAHQIYDCEESESNVDNFKLDNDMIKKLTKFQVDEKNDQTVDEKLDDIYEEFAQVSRFYGRNDIFAVMDLSYHSALSFKFQGKSVGKGWVEVCVAGDTATGKSQRALFLAKHYRAGDFVKCETAGFTGLVGGLSQHAGTWTLNWGSLPINDRKLVIIDELTGLKVEDIAKFSDIRSSGEVKIQKIITEKTRARTRIIWISNPRKDNVGVMNYPYGVNILKEIFGMPEDIRRLEMAIITASSDVDPEEVAKTPVSILPKYDSDSSHHLIQFAWSRTADDILIPKETEEYINKRSLELCKRYSPSIPLIDPGDTRFKVARCSTAIANRVFNINEDKKTVVEKKHVDAFCNLAERVYSHDTAGYRRFSIQDFQRNILKNPEEVADILGLREDYAIDELLNSATIGRQAFTGILDNDLTKSFVKQTEREKLRILKRNNAIRELTNYFVMQPGLLKLLKDLKQFLEDGNKYENFFNKELVLEKGVNLD